VCRQRRVDGGGYRRPFVLGVGLGNAGSLVASMKRRWTESAGRACSCGPCFLANARVRETI